MNYEKPEVVVLGSAGYTIQSNKPSSGEPTAADPRSADDLNLED